jgi:predicted enzyme related to lactoylglutathione lyase
MAVLRPHLALTVTDVQRAIPFYEALFGTRPEKVKSGYAKFSVTDPALNFTLTQGERGELGAFNHGGGGLAVAERAAEPFGCGETGCACAAKGAESVCCA